MNPARLLFRGFRIFFKKVVMISTSRTPCIQLGTFVTISFVLTWVAVMHTLSLHCGHGVAAGTRLADKQLAMAATGQTPNDQFYQINDADIYVYSAFFDDRYQSKYIRIFGMQSRLIPPAIQCRLKSEDGIKITLMQEMSYPVYQKWPSKQLLFHAYYYGCRVPSGYDVTKNVTLSLAAEGSDVETVVPLHITRGRAKGADAYEKPIADRVARRVVVCVKAMWGKLNATRLVEWLEFHRLLKVDKIVIYDTTILGPARRILTYYQRTGFVDLITFNYPLRMSTVMQDDPFKSQLADERMLLEQAYLVSMNDCYYRYKDVSDYILVIDQDEIILPSGDSVLGQMVLEAEAQLLNASAFLFQTAWHLEEFGISDEMAPSYLHMQRYAKRSPVMKSQPKAIISVDGAIVINWHGSVTMPTGYGFQGNQYLSSKRYGYVHHYSSHCRYTKAKCEVLSQMIEGDEIIPKYKTILAKNVADIFTRLNMSLYLL